MGGPDWPTSTLPERFGNYSILGHLATGGMAEVYIARQAGLQGFEKIVVIKRVRPELLGDSQITTHFLDEARLVATLQHPNIAQVYEIGTVNDAYFLVMEYVHGADLRQVLQRAAEIKRPISIADAVYVLIQVCVALHYAHEKRGRDGQSLHIIHRDVSPSNVLLSHDGAVKVCDFGIAKAASRTSETVRGALKGKCSYMSPEQVRGHELDRRSDIFALGIVLYELSTLTPLFTGASDFEVLQLVATAQVPKPSTKVSHYPADLERIVMKALARDPAARYQTAQAMQLDLEAFAREYRLALSSVNITKLMGELFDERVEAWVEAQRAGTPLGDYLLDTAVRNAGKLPVFLPIGTTTMEGLRYNDEPPHDTPLEDVSIDTPVSRDTPLDPVGSDTEPVESLEDSTVRETPSPRRLSGLAARMITGDGLDEPTLPHAKHGPTKQGLGVESSQRVARGSTATARSKEPTRPPPIAADAPAVPSIPRTRTPTKPPPPASEVTPLRPETAPPQRTGRKVGTVWLAGAGLAIAVALATTIAAHKLDGAVTPDAEAAVDAAADRIANALDDAAKSARLRATGVASAPIMRAAIETDAATLHDLAEKENSFNVGKGETLDVFQVQGDKSVSLLHLPSAAPALAPIASQATRFDVQGGEVEVVVGAPISGSSSGAQGVVAIAQQVDLAEVKRTLAAQTTGSSLVGLAGDIELVPRREGGVTATQVPLRSVAGLAPGAIVLVAMPNASSASWVDPVRFGALALAVFLLLGFVVAKLRAESDH